MIAGRIGIFPVLASAIRLGVPRRVSFAIANDHRELKPNGGVERCQARSERAQRNQIRLALLEFLWLEWHFFTTGSVASRPGYG